MKPALKKIFSWLERHEITVLLVCLTILLRIPSLFEPYWYGDEGIYLTIGIALKNGALLYADIVDHKTPIIYYLAMVPSQFWFRLLLMAWMVASTFLFHNILELFNLSKRVQVLATLGFILATSLPKLEGNIPNGELFVMGFVLAGLWLFTQTRTFHAFMQKSVDKQLSPHPTETAKIFASGVMFGLAVMTKVPGLFDVFPIIWIFWLVFLSLLPKKYDRLVLLILFKRGLFFILGFLLPLTILAANFIIRGNVVEFMNFGLLYNFRYAGSWGLPVSNPVLIFALSLPGKILILLAFVLNLTLLRKKISPLVSLSIIWTLAALIAATLSSRPYPHYLLQVVPPTLFLLAVSIRALGKIYVNKTNLTLALICLLLVSVTPKLLAFNYYPSLSYYTRFFSFLSGGISRDEYFQSFNGLMRDNYRVASILKQSSEAQIYIWGNNPILYALANKYPVGRFTAAFHVKEFPNAYEETFAHLLNNPPEYIIIMHDEPNSFPALEAFMYENYLPFEALQHMTVYRKSLLLDNT